MTTEARAVLARSVTERDFTDTVIGLAQLHGWMCVHFRPAMVKLGGKISYRTAGSGNVIGFPDIVAIRGARLWVVELKSEIGQPTAEQVAWLAAWAEAGAETAVYRPSDLERIEEELR